MNIATQEGYHTEFIDGQKIEKPLPKKLHARIQIRIIKLLLEAGLENAGYEVLSELNVLCGADRLVPDLTIAAKDAEYIDGDLPAAQALICVEILSPEQSLWDLFSKCERMLKAGAPCCWIIWGEQERLWRYAHNNPQEVSELPIPYCEESISCESLFKGVAQ